MEKEGIRPLSEQVWARNPFGISADKLPESGTEVPTEENALLLMTKDGDRFVPSERVRKNTAALDRWKAVISYTSAEHAGNPGSDGTKRVLSRSRVLPPPSACTETYLVAGLFDDQEPAQHLLRYLRTRFARFLLSLRVPTQHITRQCFAFVPAMPTDRTWTDADLYQHFDLDEEEIAHIERTIREMPT